MGRRHAARDGGRVDGLGRERAVGALGEPQDAVVTQVGGHLLRERERRLLARHDGERRLGPVRETRRDQERARGVGDAEGGVLPRVELAPERLEAAGALERERQRIDEHGGPFPSKTRKAA